MSLKILSANIALGIPGSDSPLQDLVSLIKFHSWRIIPFLLFRGHGGRIFNYNARPDAKRVRYFSAHSTVTPILKLIAEEQPDVIVLNELLYQTHRKPVEEGLRELGFVHISWGRSLHHPDMTVSTVVASRLPCLEDGFTPTMTQLPQISGGAGIAGLRFRDEPVTIVGFHLTKGLRKLSWQQINDLDRVYESEKANGRTTILAGDFNEHARYIEQVPSFKASRLAVIIKVHTTPVGIPDFLEADFDHVCLPPGWQALETSFRRFGSDHLAVIAELTSST